ncbi:MAG: carboxypeptidase-like regulatory domain-containing protein, partial [Acidobacteria bacterium]|nr:carboxypeptidase-like regulatory domain-containing protein [Acidobacteriota bacterium]
MRSPVTVLVLAFTAVAGPMVGQDEAAAGDRFEFVCSRESEPAGVSLRSILVAPEERWERRADVQGVRAPAECWVWSRACPPRLLGPGEDAAAACRSAGDSFAPLTIRVGAHRGLADDPGAGEDLASKLQVTAAPVAMWRQVPRRLLPTTGTMSDSLSLPRSGEPFRIQARSERLASTWRDVAAEEDAVELELRPAARFTGRVTADGSPLDGARVWLARDHGARGAGLPAEPLGFDMTDEAGGFALTLSEAERSAVIVSSTSRTAATFKRFSEVPAVVELSPGLSVSGQTVDREGRPIAAVRLQGLSWVPGEIAVMQRLAGISGPDGRFVLGGFSKGSASLQTDGGDLEFSENFDLEGSVDLGPIVLVRPDSVWLQVVDAMTSTPISGAAVRLGDGSRVVADERGIATVAPRFGRTAMIFAKGYLHAQFEIAEGAGESVEEPLLLALEPAFTVEGVYVAADGQTPAAGGSVEASRAMANGSVRRFGSVAADGAFFIDLEPGTYALELSAANAGRTRLEVSGSPGEVSDLGIVVAPASAWVSGTVVNPEYAPIEGASVSYARPSETGQLMARALGRVATVTTDIDGRFELHGLELGAATLRVEAEGYPPLEFEVEAPALEWVDAGFVELLPGRRVTVRSDVGRGVVGLDPGGKGQPLDLISADLVEGEALLDLVPDGPFIVRVSREGVTLCEKNVQDAAGDAAVTCDRSAMTVTGRVTMAGQPAAGKLSWSARANSASVSGVIRTGFGPFARSESVVPTGWQELSADLDQDGRYFLEAVLPGEWEVRWTTSDGGWPEAREVTVPDGPGEEITLNFDYGGVSIDGIVVDPEGQPVTHATVDIFPGRRAVVTGRSGRYEIMDLAPGAYQLRARFQHSRSELVDVELRDYNDRQSVRLDLRDDPSDDELVIRLAGGVGGFCFVEMEGAGQRTVRIDGGVATTKL